MELIEKAQKISTRDRVQLDGDVEVWRQVFEAPNVNGWFSCGGGAHILHHVTEVTKVRCWDLVEGCLKALHCDRCGECPYRGGPYGCHCDCKPYECEYCYPEEGEYV